MVGVAWQTELENIRECVRRVPGVARVDSFVLSWGNLLASQSVVLDVVDDLESALKQEPKHNGEEENLPSPEVADRTEVDELSQLHEEDLVEEHFKKK